MKIYISNFKLIYAGDVMLFASSFMDFPGISKIDDSLMLIENCQLIIISPN